jgi:hypothetical protein
MKKEAPLKTLRGSKKRPLMKKEAPLKTLRSSKKTRDEKRGTAKMKVARVTLDEKEAHSSKTRQSRTRVTPFLYND